MPSPKVMSGARGKLGILDPATNSVRYVGLFKDVSYGMSFDAQPVFILGRYSAAEIEYTAQEPISITASGWRVYGHGAHVEASLPRLQDLLRHEYLVLQITDRQNEGPGQKPLATFRQVRPTGYSTSLNSRNLQEMTVTFMGILMDDESTENSEAVGSMDLPS